jgi:hypothetical protein
MNSIAQFGLSIAGEQLADGQTVERRTGNLYGNGIYSSPSISLANSYAYHEFKGETHDHSGISCLILCLTLSGRPCPLSNLCCLGIPPSSMTYDSHLIFVIPLVTDYEDYLLFKSTKISALPQFIALLKFFQLQ